MCRLLWKYIKLMLYGKSIYLAINSNKNIWKKILFPYYHLRYSFVRFENNFLSLNREKLQLLKKFPATLLDCRVMKLPKSEVEAHRAVLHTVVTVCFYGYNVSDHRVTHSKCYLLTLSRYYEDRAHPYYYKNSWGSAMNARL